MNLRKARNNDVSMILDWRNSYSVRKNFFSKKKLSFKEHEKWFSKNKRKVLIAEEKGEPVGVLKFDKPVQYEDFSISIYLNPKKTRLGLGRKILKKFSKIMNGKVLLAEILINNLRSINCFLSAGYKIKSVSLIKEIK